MSDTRQEPYEGMWDFAGSCAPGTEGGTVLTSQETFTLGCFQWVRRGKDGQGKGLKKGKVQHRIKGHVSGPQDAYSRAATYCAMKNAERGRKDR